MLTRSQPLSEELNNKFESKYKDELREDEDIVSQHMGTMESEFDFSNGKVSLATRIKWKITRVKNKLSDINRARNNRKIWKETLGELYSFEGFSGLISVMLTHLKHYLEHEEKYGYSLEEYKEKKIATVKETIEILERMKEPDEYIFRLTTEVDNKYPEYQSLISNCSNGSTSFSGDFIAQGEGWVGEESGTNPRRGYFEFVNGKLELKESPDNELTNSILEEKDRYNEDKLKAYEQAEIDSDSDFDRLFVLLKENLYSWWD